MATSTASIAHPFHALFSTRPTKDAVVRPSRFTAEEFLDGVFPDAHRLTHLLHVDSDNMRRTAVLQCSEARRNILHDMYRFATHIMAAHEPPTVEYELDVFCRVCFRLVAVLSRLLFPPDAPVPTAVPWLQRLVRSDPDAAYTMSKNWASHGEEYMRIWQQLASIDDPTSQPAQEEWDDGQVYRAETAMLLYLAVWMFGGRTASALWLDDEDESDSDSDDGGGGGGGGNRPANPKEASYEAGCIVPDVEFIDSGKTSAPSDGVKDQRRTMLAAQCYMAIDAMIRWRREERAAGRQSSPPHAAARGESAEPPTTNRRNGRVTDKPTPKSRKGTRTGKRRDTVSRDSLPAACRTPNKDPDQDRNHCPSSYKPSNARVVRERPWTPHRQNERPRRVLSIVVSVPV